MNTVNNDASGQQSSDTGVEVDIDQLLRLYRAGQHDQLSRAIYDIYCTFSTGRFGRLTSSGQDAVDKLVALICEFISRPDFVVSRQPAMSLVANSYILSDLVACSSFGTTDQWLMQMLKGRFNAAKFMMLCGPRNHLDFDRSRLLAIDAELASMWYWSYCAGASTLADKTVHENILAQMRFCDDPRLDLPTMRLTHIYFGSTYSGSELERAIKQRMNELIRRRFADRRIANRPSRRSVAVVTGSWMKTHSVFRSISPMVETLAGDYDLTLLDISSQPERVERGMFKRVIRLRTDQRDRLNLDHVSTNDFQAAIFPDVGMSEESRVLMNMRLAPVQIAAYGHPASTFGARIDYFIGGSEAELAEHAARNYSERLVLIPGLGAHPTQPAECDESAPPRPPNVDIVVNCPWSAQKVNHPLLTTLSEAAGASGRRVLFRFYPAKTADPYLPFYRDLCRVLGEEAVEVAPPMTQGSYMAWMREGDFSIDSYPFGGYNSIIDSIHLGKPVIAWEGDKFYSRASSALLRRFGLHECIATDRSQYIQKIARLIADDTYRDELTNRVRKLNLTSLLLDRASCDGFRKAVDHVIDNHAALQALPAGEPVVVA